jgi:hypothetical protein
MLKVFENRVLRGIFGSKRHEVKGNGEECMSSSFMLPAPHEIALRCLNKEERDEWVMWNVQGRG